MCTIQAGIAPVKGWLGMPLPKVRGRAAPLMPTSEASTSVRRRFSIAIEVAAGQHSARVLYAPCKSMATRVPGMARPRPRDATYPQLRYYPGIKKISRSLLYYYSTGYGFCPAEKLVGWLVGFIMKLWSATQRKNLDNDFRNLVVLDLLIPRRASVKMCQELLRPDRS